MIETIFSQVRSPVLSALSELLRDENFKEDIIYKKYVSQEFSVAEGHIVETFQSYRISAVRMRHNKESVKVSASDVQVGDVLFILKWDDLPGGPSLKDQIEDAAGNTLGVKGIDPVFDLAALVTVQAGA